MTIQYDTDEERKLHFGVIHTLADQYALDEATIREIYESGLEKLMDSARIKTYLAVLAVRHVKSYLHESRLLPSGMAQQERSH